MREKGRHTKGITLHIVPVNRRRCSPTETESSTALLTGGGDTSHRRIALEATMESGVMAKVGRSIFYYSEPEISDGSRANSAESLCSDDSSLSANEPVAGVSTGSLPCRGHHGRERFIAVPGPDGVTLAQLTHSGFLKAFPQNPLNRRGSEDMLSKDKDSDTESCNSGVAPTAPSKRTSIPRRSSTGSYEMSTARRKLVAARQKLGRKATGSFRSTADKTSQSDAKHGDLKRSLSPQLGRYIKSYLLRQGSPKHALLRASHIHATSEADVKPPMNQRRLVALRRDPIIGYGFQLQSFSFHTECGSLQYATYVNKVIPDGPGHVGGLQPGDVIMEVDNTNVEREGAKSITEMIRRTGPAVRLTVVFMDAVRRVRLQRRLEELKSDLCTKKLELMDLVEKERELTGKLSPGSHHGSPTKYLSPSKSPAGQGFVRESHVERSPNRTSHVQKSPSRSSQDSSDLSPDYVEITGSQDDVFSSHLGSTSGVPGSSATLPPSGRSDVAGSSGRSRRVSSDRDSVYGEELKQLKAVLQHFESLQRYKEEKIASNNHGDHTKENPHSGTWPRQQSPASRHRLSREKKRDPSPNHTDSCPTTYDRRRHHSRRESIESGANSAENSVVAVSAPESPQGRLSRQNSLEKEKELEGHLHALRRKHKSGRLSAKSSDEVYV